MAAQELVGEGEVLYVDLGYYVMYKTYQYHVDITVYEVYQQYDENHNLMMVTKVRPFLTDCDCHPTDKLESADVYATGFIKWDGCSNWDFKTDQCTKHFCGKVGVQKFGQLLEKLYDLAADKVPAWDGIK